MSDKLLGTREVLAKLRISRKTLYALMHRGKITPIEKPSYLTKHPKLQFRESDVDALLNGGSDDEPHAA